MDYFSHLKKQTVGFLDDRTLGAITFDAKCLSPAAIAAKQLEDTGKFLRPGQTVKFIYTLGEPGVHAWDLEYSLDRKMVDIQIYKTLLDRAMETVVQPFDLPKLQPSLPLFVSDVGNKYAYFK
jgi:hypothetical protein